MFWFCTLHNHACDPQEFPNQKEAKNTYTSKNETPGNVDAPCCVCPVKVFFGLGVLMQNVQLCCDNEDGTDVNNSVETVFTKKNRGKTKRDCFEKSIE